MNARIALMLAPGLLAGLLALEPREQSWNDPNWQRPLPPTCPQVVCPAPPPVPPCPQCPSPCPANFTLTHNWPQTHCPTVECPQVAACPAVAGSCSGCLWKVLVTYDHFKGFGFYKAFKDPVNWHNAKLLCENDGGHLGIINSKEEEEIFKLLYRKERLGGWIFVGFHDLNVENKFETVLGQLLTETGYLNWRPGQPDNAGNEDCGTIDELARLNDGQCEWKFGFICEVNEKKAFGQKG